MADDDNDQATRDRLKKLVPPGNNIQITPSSQGAGTAFDPDAFAASGGKSAEERQAAAAAPQPLKSVPPGYDPAAFKATGQSAEERAASAAPGSAVGQSGGHVMDAWNGFIGHPENRAGLMQFAVNMLSGKGFGESLGAAAEATGRNVEKQQEEQKFEEQQALKEREVGAYETTARAHMIAAGKKSGADTYYEHLAAQEGKQDRESYNKLWQAWLDDPVAGAGILKDVKQRFPGITSKSDLQRAGNEEALRYAQQRHYALVRGASAGAAGAGAPAFNPPAGAVAKNVNGRKVYYDPKTERPYPGQ